MRFAITLPLLMAVALAMASSAHAIELHRSLEAARKASPDPKPAVLIFGADWCGWCRKYETTTLTDEKLAEPGKAYLWVKIDVDRAPDLAAQYGASGVPLTIALNEAGTPIGARAGYMTVEELLAFVQESIANPQPWFEPVEGLVKKLREADSSKTIREAVAAIVERLAKPERHARKDLLAAIAARGADAWPALLALMEDDRLAVRAAAAGALAQAVGKPLAFNPFADAVTREAQLAQCRDAASAPVEPP